MIGAMGLKPRRPRIDFGSDPLLARVRALCMAYPEAVETTSFGNPTFKAGSRTFAVLDRYRGRPCLAFKADVSLQQSLLEQEAYAASPFGAAQGWTLLWTDREVDAGVLSDLIEMSYRQVALRRMLAALDEL
jgi:predicted DNA-binding protein (MmcQ/YjbR family)